MAATDARLGWYQKHESPHVRNRANIILLTLDGKTPEAISETVGLSLKTVKKWQDAWETDGFNIFPALQETEAMRDEPQATAPVAEQTNLEVTSPTATDHEATEASEDSILELVFKVDALMPDDPMAEAGRKVMLARLSDMLESESEARLGEDIEGVHKMRVATRRWRSAFDVFDHYLPRSYRKELYDDLCRTARKLGAVRDLDVFLNNARKYIKAELNDDADDLQPMLQRIEKKRRRARKDLLRWLDHKKYAAFTERAVKRLTKPTKAKTVRLSGTQPRSLRLDHLLPAMIYARLENVRRYEDVLEDAPIEILHELRIDCKRLRYTLEAFETVLGESISMAIQATKSLQDHLGDMNDTEVGADIVREVSKRLEDKSAKAAAKAYRKALQNQQQKLLDTFPEAWAQFNHDIRDALARAVAVL